MTSPPSSPASASSSRCCGLAGRRAHDRPRRRFAAQLSSATRRRRAGDRDRLRERGHRPSPAPSDAPARARPTPPRSPPPRAQRHRPRAAGRPRQAGVELQPERRLARGRARAHAAHARHRRRRSASPTSTDPAQALEGGAKYLRQQLDRFGGDVASALAAYNAGPGAVAALRRRPALRRDAGLRPQGPGLRRRVPRHAAPPPPPPPCPPHPPSYGIV